MKVKNANWQGATSISIMFSDGTTVKGDDNQFEIVSYKPFRTERKNDSFLIDRTVFYTMTVLTENQRQAILDFHHELRNLEEVKEEDKKEDEECVIRAYLIPAIKKIKQDVSLPFIKAKDEAKALCLRFQERHGIQVNPDSVWQQA